MRPIVIDASAAFEALVLSEPGRRVLTLLMGANQVLAPRILVPETLSVLKKEIQRGAISKQEAVVVVGDLCAWDVEFRDVRAEKVWALCESLSAYDACYVALAMELGVPLLTLDKKLTRAAHAFGLCEVLVP